MTDQAFKMQSCLASARDWRHEAENLRALARGAHLTSEQNAMLLREAEAADRQAEWWVAGAKELAPSDRNARP